MSEELTSLDKLHEKVDAELVLEYIIHAHNERMLNRVQDVLLQFDVLVLLIIYHNIFPNTFHRVYASRVDVLNKIDLSESALSDHLHNDEILEFDLIPLLLPLKDECTTGLHASTSTWPSECIRGFLLVLIIVVIVVVLVLIREVLALLELLITDLYVLLEVVQLVSSII